MQRFARTFAIAALLLLLAACGPEAGRARGAGFGTGADPGNHATSPQEVLPKSKVFTTTQGEP